MARKRREESSSGTGEWITTYSDLVTLLLCFFVLLFAMSAPDAEKFRGLMASFRGGDGVMSSGTGVLEGGNVIDRPSFNTTEEEVAAELVELMADLAEYSDTLNLGDRITIQPEERGIVIRFMDSTLFDSGSATIKREALGILKDVAEILNQEEFSNKHIKVEGHTDSDQIIRPMKYETNWELSSARATNVLRYLVEVEGIVGDRVSSAGYSYYRGIVPNDTPENKAKNRRVDIVILRDSFEELEP